MRFDGYTKIDKKEPIKIVADFDDHWLIKGRRHNITYLAYKEDIHVLKKSKWYTNPAPPRTTI